MAGTKKKKSDIQQVVDFWKSVMDDDEINIQHRLKASELCIKLSQENGEEDVSQVIICGENEIEN